MSDAVAIAQEQVAWWIVAAYTPADALRAMGIKIPAGYHTHPVSWGFVLDSAMEMHDGLAAVRRAKHQAALGLVAA